MKKTIFAGILFATSHVLVAQINPKLQPYVNESSYNKQKQLSFITLKENPGVKENEVPAFINSLIFNDGLNKVVLLKEEKDELGFTHTKYSITQNGIILYNKVIAAHCRAGQLQSLNGELRIFEAPVNKFSLTEKSALAFALKKVHAKKYKWENKQDEEHVRQVMNKPDFTYYPTGVKTIIEKNGKLYNAYQFSIYAEIPLYRANVFVDATTGKILDEKSQICDINVPGSMATKYSGTQTVTIDQNGSVYRMRETVRGLGVETYNMNNTATYAQNDFTNTTSSYTGVNVNQGARDAHWGAEKTYDYYFTQHNRNSIDNAGFKLISYIHYNTNYANAFWDGMRMTYGDGSGNTTIFTALDVCGHEVSHGLTENTAGLDYANEPGALNESYSDIFGTCIENYARPGNWNWKMGEDLMTNAVGLRNMSNPTPFSDPDTYTGQFWYVGTADNGGVHTNSGVSNYWFYLLTTGGSGTNDLGNAYTVSSIGMTAASRIAFRALTVYYTPFTDYANARALSIQAAKDLYGNCSIQVEQTARAWYAVGVGTNFSTNVISPDFQSLVTNYCAVPVTVNFNNISSNGLSYSWSFGDGGVATTTNAAHTYTNSGTYNVKLKATGCANAIDSITKPSYIVINVPPSPLVSNGSSCGSGAVTLSATGTGIMNWYTNPFATVPLSTGNLFQTPNLSSNATFYVANNIANTPVFGGKTNTVGTGGTITNAANWLIFDVLQNSTLNSVVAYASSGGARTVQLRNNGTVIYSTTFNLVAGANTLPLNYVLTPGTNYELGLAANTAASLFRNTASITFPYNIASCVKITGSNSGYYYWFYNWQVTKADCMSPAVAVNASIFPLPVSALSAPVNLFCTGDAPVNLTGTPAGGLFSGANVASGIFNPVNTGNSSVVYTYNDPNGCSDTSMIDMQVMSCTGLKSLNGTQVAINIFPNPANDHVIVTNDSGNLKMTILDASGKLVLSRQIASGEENISLSNLAKGLYLVQVSDLPGKILSTQKLVKN